MSVKLLTEHNLEFLSLKGGCTGLSESTPVKMPHCWKSHAAAHIRCLIFIRIVWCFVLGPCLVVWFLVSFLVEQALVALV